MYRPALLLEPASRSALGWTAIRLTLAILIAAHGWARLLAGAVTPFGDWLDSLGFPFGSGIAVFITALEIIGTLFLAFGRLVLPLTLIYATIYAVGIVLVHAPAGWFVVGLGRNGSEYSVLLIVCLICVGLQHVRVRAGSTSAMDRPIFHLSFPVLDLSVAKAFYCDVLGATVGRDHRDWADILLFGHQLTLHQRPDEVLASGDQGVRHFGAILPWQDWAALRERLESRGCDFLRPPDVVGAGTEQEHGKMLLCDPSGNVIEIKAYRNAAAAFAMHEPAGA